MIGSLLATMQSPVVIAAIVVIAVGLVGAIVYGIFRRLVRMNWFVYQLLILFALSLLIPLAARTNSSGWNFAIASILLMFFTAAVLVAGELLRRAILMKNHRAPLFVRILDRLLGAFTAVLDLVMLAAIVGGAVLALLYYAYPVPALDVVFTHPVWVNFGAKYALDLLFLATCLAVVEAGYRIGVTRSLQTAIMLALIFGAIVLSLFLAFRVPFLRSFGSTIGTGFGLKNAIAASAVGFLVVTFLLFLLFFAVIVVGVVFSNKLVLKLHENKTFTVVDGSILAAVFYFFFLLIACGTDAGIIVVANGVLNGVEGFGPQVTEIFNRIVTALQSSPVRDAFFSSNPFIKVSQS